MEEGSKISQMHYSKKMKKEISEKNLLINDKNVIINETANAHLTAKGLKKTFEEIENTCELSV